MKYIPLLGFKRRCIIVSGELLVPKFIYFAGSPGASGQRFWKIWELFVLLPILLHSNRSRVLSAGTAMEQLVRMLVKFREWIFDTWN